MQEMPRRMNLSVVSIRGRRFPRKVIVNYRDSERWRRRERRKVERHLKQEEAEAEDQEMSKVVERMGDLELLPISVVQTIIKRLDAADLCSMATSCRILRTYVKEALQELECVHIPKDTFLNRGQVDAILEGNVRLKRLKLDCARLLDFRGLNNFTKPTLEELVLYNCDTLSSLLFEKIGQECSSLKDLHLQFGWRGERSQRGHFHRHCGNRRYSYGLEIVLEGCKQLESLCLRWDVLLRIFDREAFEAIPRLTVGSLKSLELGFLAERDARSVLEVRRGDLLQQVGGPWGGYPVLEKLCLGLDRITDSLLAIITANVPHLKYLDLSDEPTEEPLLGFDLTNVGVITISSMRGLRHLSLVRKPDYFPTSFKRVSDLGILLLVNGCDQLERVRLGGFTRITDAGCKSFLLSCLKLQAFELANMNQVTDLLFHDFSASTMKLECVALSSCVLLTDWPIARLSKCKRLRSLDLNNCKSVGDDSLKALSSLSQLETLVLNGTDVSDYGLWWLGQGVTPLTEISLRYCSRLTSKGIHALLSGAVRHTLESLDLSGINSLTDEAIRQVVHSGVRLNELWLRDCPLLTCESLGLLAESHASHTLRLLDLWNSRGIREVTRWLRKPYFPRLRFLGVPKSVDAANILSLLEVRPSLTIKRSGRRSNDWMGDHAGLLDAISEGALTDEEWDGLELWIADGD